MRTKKIKNPAKLFCSVGNSVGNCRRYSCRRTRVRHAWSVGNAVGNSVGMSADKHVACMRGPSVIPSVYVQTDTCQACVRQTVGNSVGSHIEISIGNPSVSVAKSRNFFATLCEIPTGYMPSVLESEKPSVNVAKSVIFLQLSVKYRRVIFRRYIRR